MRVIRGRAATIEADRDLSRQLLSFAADGDPAVRVWTPHRQVAFGRRDRRLEGYDRACERARERAFPPVERDVGGRAVAYDGETTLAFARAEPVADFRRGTDERYERATNAIVDALRSLEDDLEPVRGEPSDSFCPGTHSLSHTREGDGEEPERKVVGIAQRVRQDAAVTAGIVLVARREELTATLEDVYGALEVPFDPESVGTVAGGGGPSDPSVVRSALEDALVGERADVTIEPVSETYGNSDANERR
ncbi:lipoate--protein ligase family protein [Natronorubrum sp. JWXQ-INN-674]|uniref:Lipoate--protein ligase family protein n=1 Tax=Natronorubrum halalkaliphilum TaxID=2691917 RepID=A0A6B0VRU0_9EURY|nr:lipoate--protein ligase family protein [Natronorubrum halalkaliphilum]MXV63219.1 lipoate--protein ligase family protein [Natronorubrum halalkaliphilum]